jgi:hypothetical protein
MSDFDRWLAQILSFDPVLGVSQKDKERFTFCIKLIVQRYQEQLGNSSLFSKLQKITVTTGRNPVLSANNVIGLDQFLNHEIYVSFFDYPDFDSSIDSHELAHEALNYLLPEPESPDANNLVHYAYNMAEQNPHLPYLVYKDIKYHNWLQFFRLDRTAFRYRLSYADLGLLLKDRDKIRAEIKAGTAPQWPNHYWPY